MIASRVSGQRWLSMVLISLLATTMWRTWPVAQEDLDVAPPATYHHVPLLGMSLDDAIEEASGGRHSNPPREAPAGPVKTCLPFLAPILAHPNWQLRITNGQSNCFNGIIHIDFSIASTGEVTWTRPGGPTRRLALSSEQLALVRRLDRLSCVALEPDGTELDWLSIGLDLGKHQEYGGARVPPASVLGRTVTAMLNERTARYREERRAAIGALDLRLAARERGRVYRVQVTGDRLTVKRGRKVLVDEPVDAEQVVDLVDLALERHAADQPVGLLLAKGELLLDGRRVPVTVERYERGPFEQLERAILAAQFHGSGGDR